MLASTYPRHPRNPWLSAAERLNLKSQNYYLPMPAHDRRAGSAAVHRRRVQRQSGAGRLGVHPPPSGIGQGNGGLRRRAKHDQQPDGTHGGDSRPRSAPSPFARRAVHRQRICAARASASGCPNGRPTAGGRKAADRTKRSRIWNSGNAWTNSIAKHDLNYTRVAGHSGHPENDRCDELAVAAAREFNQ